MESIVNGLETSDMLRYFISAYDKCEDKKTANTQKGFAVTYKDDYGFEAENKYGVRIVFRPDISEGYIEIEHKKYSLNSEQFSRYKNKVPDVNNENIDNKIDMEVIRSLESLRIYEKLLGLNLISMRNRNLYVFDSYSAKKFFSMDDDFLIWLFNNTSIRTSKRFNYWFEIIISYIYKKFGREIAEYFAMAYNKASIEFHTAKYYCREELASQLCEIMKDPKRTIDYLLFETYAQGIRIVNIDKYVNYVQYVDENPSLGLTRYPMNFESMYTKTAKYRSFHIYPEIDLEKYKILSCRRQELPADVPVFAHAFSLIDKDSEEVVAIFGDRWLKPVVKRELTQEEKDIVETYKIRKD